jgi:restriction endonuclease
MDDLPALNPETFRILVGRELRKVGLDVGAGRIHRRAELPEPERGFVLELVLPLSKSGSLWRALVVCRRQSGAVGPDVVESVKARLPAVPADVALVFATSDFAADAVAAAQEAGVALLRVVDGRTALDTSPWSGGERGHYPAWLPAYLPQLIDRDLAGQPRARLLEAGRADMILERFAQSK